MPQADVAVFDLAQMSGVSIGRIRIVLNMFKNKYLLFLFGLLWLWRCWRRPDRNAGAYLERRRVAPVRMLFGTRRRARVHLLFRPCRIRLR